MRNYEVQPYIESAIPDAGRWLIVYHDGDEESHVQHLPGGGFRLGATSGSWQVASAANPGPRVTRLDPEATDA